MTQLEDVSQPPSIHSSQVKQGRHPDPTPILCQRYLVEHVLAACAILGARPHSIAVQPGRAGSTRYPLGPLSLPCPLCASHTSQQAPMLRLQSHSILFFPGSARIGGRFVITYRLGTGFELLLASTSLVRLFLGLAAVAFSHDPHALPPFAFDHTHHPSATLPWSRCQVRCIARAPSCPPRNLRPPERPTSALTPPA